MGKWMDAYITSYRPSAKRAPYRAIMNSSAMQAVLRERAKAIAESAKSQPDIAKYKELMSSRVDSTMAGVDMLSTLVAWDEIVSADVRPGKNRAHARVRVRRIRNIEHADRYRNIRIDRALQAAMESQRISRKR